MSVEVPSRNGAQRARRPSPRPRAETESGVPEPAETLEDADSVVSPSDETTETTGAPETAEAPGAADAVPAPVEDGVAVADPVDAADDAAVTTVLPVVGRAARLPGAAPVTPPRGVPSPRYAPEARRPGGGTAGLGPSGPWPTAHADRGSPPVLPGQPGNPVVTAAVVPTVGRRASPTPSDEGSRGSASTEGPGAPARAVLVALAAVLVLLGAGGGALGALLWPATYAARAEILYPITKEQPTGFLRDDRNLTTQVVLLTSRTVLGPVAEQLRMPLDDLQHAVTVELVSGSEVVQVEGRDRSPQVAMSIVAALVDRYMAVQAESVPSNAKAYLQGQLEAVRGQLGTRQSAVGRAATTDPEVQALRAREQEILSQLDESTVVDVSGPQAQVLAPPYPVEKAVSPRIDLAAAAGALAGTLVAAAVVGWVLRRRSPS